MTRPQFSCAVKISTLLCSVITTGSLFASSPMALADNCPNAVFRNGPSSRLPDCRAYEMVTPPYKEGYQVLVSTTITNHGSSNFSPDGSGVEGESFGVFAGAEDDVFSIQGSQFTQGASYVFTRGVSGWHTTAISLPAGQYGDPTSWALSSDLAKSLWVGIPSQDEGEAQATRQPETLYVRTLNGPVIDVGPIVPPGEASAHVSNFAFRFWGVSSTDLSAVLFSLHEVHWPGDKTNLGGESLYEYVGTGNEAPLLVGVSGSVGSASLISKCGTLLSVKGEFEPFTAISEDGSTVFFTALACGPSPAVQELYARIDNSQPDAHTVAISEPSEEDCAECDTANSIRRPAVGVGASADGSKEFFMTSQPLLGADESSNIYEYDFNGEVGHRVVRVSGGDSTVTAPVAAVERVVSMSTDGSHVYFLASGLLTKNRNSVGQEAVQGESNLYLYERDGQYPNGRIAFVLPGADYTGSSQSQNGRFLAFTTTAHLTPDDLSPFAQGFEYDSQTGGIVRVSIGENGFNDNGNAGSVGRLLVANDGAVFFETANPLVPQAVNGLPDVYEYRGGQVSLISSGQDTGTHVNDSLDSITPSGSDVFFQTYDQLVPQDTDFQEDTYDARVGGGFAEPPPPPHCEGDACQGPLSGSPVLLSPGSEFQAGGENIASAIVGSLQHSTKAIRGKGKTKRRKIRRRKAKKSNRRGHQPSTAGIGAQL